ncbi:MAG: transposase, partial [Proteobacteria bacterium]|nr:transposase [Pseudomonadota bacterium]
MPSLTKKIINGKPYYYARECKRVNGKPKIVWQKYLGKAEDIIDAMSKPQIRETHAPPKEAIVTELGALAALYDLAKRLKLVEFIDRHVPTPGDGPSVGNYLLIAILNRCIAPCSKAKIAKWFQKTILRRLIDISPRQLTSQRFWDRMDLVSQESIVAIERDITGHMVGEFDIALEKLLFDATNFFTFIDTFNDRCDIAKRGKSKEGRKSLRIVGVALLVSADFHIPLLHKTYPGNQADSNTFADLIPAITKRCREITQEMRNISVVFDKGNNSPENLDYVDKSPVHFVGSL